MVNKIYPPEQQLNKANISDTEAPFLVLHLSVANGFVSSKSYDKRDDFNFDIVNFPFLDGDVPLRTFLNLLGLLESAIMLRTSTLEAKLLQQGYRYHILRKHFLNFIVDTMN